MDVDNFITVKGPMDLLLPTALANFHMQQRLIFSRLLLTFLQHHIHSRFAVLPTAFPGILREWRKPCGLTIVHRINVREK